MTADKIKPDPISPPRKSEADERKDRPGFDLGGADGDDKAGRGLGLGKDAKDDREAQRLPRGGKT
jgi:hypothetical protein